MLKIWGMQSTLSLPLLPGALSGVVYWPSTRPTMPFQSDAPERKWHIPIASNRKKSRRRISLTKWDKVKAYDILIDWCTGREWLLNCMTVISAWWRSNMPFQRLRGRLSGRLNYYITRWDRKSESWRSDELVIREATTQQKGPSGPPMKFGDPLVTR